MQTNEFIENFKLIEKHINKIGNFPEEKSFKSKVSELSKNSLISRFREDLNSFSNLRNLLSHEPKKNGDYIAKPTDFTVNRIKEIHQLITNPPLVFPKFKFEVLGAENKDYWLSKRISCKLILVHQGESVGQVERYQNRA